MAVHAWTVARTFSAYVHQSSVETFVSLQSQEPLRQELVPIARQLTVMGTAFTEAQVTLPALLCLSRLYMVIVVINAIVFQLATEGYSSYM